MPNSQANDIYRSHRGPSPLCLCGTCHICKNRKRQQRFRERKESEKEYETLSKQIDEETFEDPTR